MKTITIQGQKRETVGKKDSNALRDAGLVPCVIYGKNEPVHFSATELSFKNLVYTQDAHLVDIQIEKGSNAVCILQDIQFHPVTDKILHVDFYEINEGKAVTLDIPVRLTGRSKGVMNGGVLRFAQRKLRVKAVVDKLPEEIVIDITNLKIGNKVYIKELINDNYAILHPDNQVVVMVKTSRVAITTAADDDEDEEGEEGSEGGAEASTEEGGGEAAE